MPLSVVETSLVPTRLSLSRSSMVSSRDMEKRLSFQTTMRSRVLSSRVASEIILGEFVPVAGGVPERGCNCEASCQAVLAAGGFLVLFGDDAAGCWQGVSDVDGGFLHGVASWRWREDEPTAPASSPFTVCQALRGSFT